jgi:hypothetical protein
LCGNARSFTGIEGAGEGRPGYGLCLNLCSHLPGTGITPGYAGRQPFGKVSESWPFGGSDADNASKWVAARRARFNAATK